MKVCFVTFGCKTNQYDTEAMRESLLRTGHVCAEEGEPCDAVVVNSCAVTANACAQARQAIHRITKWNGEPFVAVVGCYPQIDPQAVAAIEGVDLVLGTAEKTRIAEFLEKCSLGVHVSEVRTFAVYPEAQIEGHYGHTRALLKLQEGCNQACAYCIVPQARGMSRRRSLELVVEEAKRVIARGYREIVLTGTHLEEENVFQVVTALEGVPGLRRLRVSSMDPNEISERLLGLLASLEKCCRHLHIAVQSGDDGILERMRRPYGRQGVVSLLERIQGILGEDVGIGADFLVGFPGEDEKAFAHTYQLIAEIPFTYLHLFPFSPRPGTAASAMRPVVPQAMVRERLKALKELGERKREEFQERFIDREVEVLVEHRCKKGKHWLTGLTENYLRVSFDGPEALQGRLAKILITRQEDGRLIGGVKV